MKKTFSRALSVILAVVMLAVSVPVAFAAESIALTESNVLEWPTVLYKNENGEFVTEGSMHYGQKMLDCLALTGGVVTTDGTKDGEKIEGKFEFDFGEKLLCPTEATDAHPASVKFVPKDETAYTGFSVSLTKNVTFKVNSVTPVLVDENDPPVASSVESAGKRLMTSTISGGAVKNPYTGEVLLGSWSWVSRFTAVNESKTYPAKLAVAGYEVLNMDIYVSITGDAPATKIEVPPTFGEVTYAPGLTIGDLTISGGKAVISQTGEEIEGTFAVVEESKNVAVKVGERTVSVLFTPTDLTKGITCICQVPLVVNKAVPAFKTDDESGIPTITMPYGTKLDSSLDAVIKPLVDVDVPVYLAYKDFEGNDLSYNGTTPVVGTHEIQVRVNIDDSNYETFTMLTFKLEITGFTANCIMEPVGSQGYKIHDTSLKYDAAKPTGTFTVSYTVDGEKQPDITVKYEELFQVEKSKSGKYEFSVKYNEIENDPFEIADITYTGTVVLNHNVTINGQKQTVDYNATVTASAPATDPAQPEKPYYGFVSWEATGVDISEEQAASAEITFTMPDNDVELKANYKFSIKLFFEWVLAQITQFFTFIVNAVKDLIAMM